MAGQLHTLRYSRPVVRTSLALLLLCGASAAHAQVDAPACERVVIVPLDPAGLTAQAAKVEEEKLRELVAKTLSGLCVQPRKEAAEVLKSLEGRRLPVCDEVSCRQALAERFGADWLVSGTAYGLGGGRTVTLNLWSKDGLRVQRGSYASGTGVDEAAPSKAIITLFREARMGQAFAGTGAQEPPEKARRARWPEVALASAAVAALAGGIAFGTASEATERRISTKQTGCPGAADVYATCFANTVNTGRQQATTANIFFATSAILGAAAGVIFVVELE